jgi:hypothetical protein
MRNKQFFLLAVFAIASGTLFFGSDAYARVAVEGSREFTDDVNGCLNTYRNSPGVVGDVIRELERSQKEHKIMNSPDWNNSVNNGENAMNGTGTGTVTRVDKAELEKYKKSFPELKDKDFCTALLHELWHAVDADRGEWASEKQAGVDRDEIEATMFQNFVHAIRQVPPRIAYGGVDISAFVLRGDDKPKEVVKPPEPEPKKEIRVATSYNHVAPGQYSEVYAAVTASPSAAIQAVLSGPGVASAASQTVTAGADGTAKFTWRIVSYGTYTLNGTAGGEKFGATVNVR